MVVTSLADAADFQPVNIIAYIRHVPQLTPSRPDTSPIQYAGNGLRGRITYFTDIVQNTCQSFMKVSALAETLARCAKPPERFRASCSG